MDAGTCLNAWGALKVIGPVNPAAKFPHSPSLPVIRPFHSVFLLSLTVVSLTSCAGPKVALSKSTPPAAPGATPAAVGTPPAAPEAPPDPNVERDAFWNLAMKRYVPPETGLQPAAIELTEPSTTSPSTTSPGTMSPGTAAAPAPAVSTMTSASKPAINSAPARELNPADIPFATWAPGKRGIVKSPFDPNGRLIDVRDFSSGQLSQCPYTGKIFRVPPLK